MGFSPRSKSHSSAGAAAATQSLAAPSPAPKYLGFDIGEYPGDTAMRNFITPNTPFHFTGFYLPSEANSYNTSWMNKRSFLQGLGYGFAILYVGRLRTELTYQRGQTDGDEAVNKAIKAGFTDGVIYLDVEAIPDPAQPPWTPARMDYISGWLDKVDSYAAWYPGVYCSYLGSDQIKNSKPNMSIRFWVYRLGIPPSPGCTTAIGQLTPSDSGVSYASTWQYAIAPTPTTGCSQTWNGTTLHLDLDMSNYENPSVP